VGAGALSFQDDVELSSLIFSALQVGLIDPGSFKLLDEMLQKEVKNGKAKVETMSFSVVEGESVIE
jgi:hypothetical protein